MAGNAAANAAGNAAGSGAGSPSTSARLTWYFPCDLSSAGSSFTFSSHRSLNSRAALTSFGSIFAAAGFDVGFARGFGGEVEEAALHAGADEDTARRVVRVDSCASVAKAAS
jgi:hypothetical protein